MALINTTTTGVLGSTFYADGSGDLTVQQNGVTINQISSTGLLYGRLTSMTAQASTSGTSIDFTSIPSWVKRVTVMYSGLSTSSTSRPIVQLGTSGGIQNTGYAGMSWMSNTTNTAYSDGFLIIATMLATYSINGVSTISLLNSATGIWNWSSIIGETTGSNVSQGGGSKTLSGTLDRIRITTQNGTDTFDAGSVNVLYE